MISMSRNSICNCPIQLSGTGGSNAVKRAPEGAIQHMFVPMYLPAVTWSSPVSNKLLLEAGQSALIMNSHSVQMDGVRTGDIQITDVGLNTIYGSAQGTRHSVPGEPQLTLFADVCDRIARGQSRLQISARQPEQAGPLP